MSLLLGIDLGTSVCKAAVYDEDGTLRGEGAQEIQLIARTSDWIEQDAEAWWQGSLNAIRLALACPAVDRRAVRGMAVSSQGLSFVLLDDAGRPLGNAISWLDSRGQAETDDIAARLPADELCRTTGKRAAPYYVLPKLMWLRRHEPEIWARARRLCMAHDYVAYRLSGEIVTDHSMAGGTLVHDLAALDWSEALLGEFGIPRALLPELRWSGTAVGPILPAVAAELGLRPGAMVVVGGQDQKCAALGAGITDALATVSLGTASAIVRVLDRPTVDLQRRIPTFAFVQPGWWVLEGVVGTAAASLRWFRELAAPEMTYGALDEAAAAIGPGDNEVLFMPHLSGASSPHWVSAARGVFHGLNLSATRAHLWRAILEGVAYQVQHNLAIAEELSGVVEGVVLFGGGARSALWRAIIGDVLDRPVATAPTVETAGVGAAMLAGCGCGVFGTLDEARSKMVGRLQLRQPDPASVARYASARARYTRIEEVVMRTA